ncbi:MAG: hypothetical protein LBB90_01630 [Tannerella sp.]|jgi:hypothetical protein|nr:hypothetical protein [Tannerella sp.]
MKENRNGFGISPLMQEWFEEQKELLMESELEQVIENIGLTKSQSSEKEKLINYHQTNIERIFHEQTVA